MAAPASPPPDDPETLRALLVEAQAENERLRQIILAMRRHRFGRRAESLPEDQLLLGLEEAEQVEAAGFAAEEAEPARKATRVGKRRTNRGALPAHLPRVETLVDIDSTACPCCAGALHKIGEDVSERLDVVPAQFRVLVIRRPRYACRACEDAFAQAPAPARLIEGGLPTDALVAQVLVSKYADHLPLYRQAQIYARQGVVLDPSTLADWVGRAAFLLRPVHARLLETLKRSGKLFADETTAPVLDPGRGRTKTGQLWAYARTVDPAESSALYRQHVAGRLAGVTPRVVQAAACLYTVTPDNGFIIDWHPAQNRVLTISACSGHSFKHSAGIGKVAADLLVDGHCNIDTNAFSIKRFQ